MVVNGLGWVSKEREVMSDMKINWKKKLTSRKFWVAGAGLASGIVIFICGNQELAAQISSLILSAASVVAYIIGEGLADASYNSSNGTVTTKTINSNTTVDYFHNTNTPLPEGSVQVNGVDIEQTEIAGSKCVFVTPQVTCKDGITVDGKED